jgi:hypothetical protein
MAGLRLLVDEELHPPSRRRIDHTWTAPSRGCPGFANWVPPLFSQVLILKSFKSFVFVSTHSKGVTGAKVASAVGDVCHGGISLFLSVVNAALAAASLFERGFASRGFGPGALPADEPAGHNFYMLAKLSIVKYKAEYYMPVANYVMSGFKPRTLLKTKGCGTRRMIFGDNFRKKPQVPRALLMPKSAERDFGDGARRPELQKGKAKKPSPFAEPTVWQAGRSSSINCRRAFVESAPRFSPNTE